MQAAQEVVTEEKERELAALTAHLKAQEIVFTAGINDFANTNYDGAIYHFKLLVNESKYKNAENIFWLGASYLRKKNYAQAMEYFHQVVSYEQSDADAFFRQTKNYKAEAYYAMALAYQETGNAVASYEQILLAIEENPGDARYYDVIAELVSKKKPLEAIEYYQKAIQLDSKKLTTTQIQNDGNIFIGDNIFIADDITEYMWRYKKILQLCEKLRYNDLAIKFCEEASKVDSLKGYFSAKIAKIYYKQERYPEAIKFCEKAIKEINPNITSGCSPAEAEYNHLAGQIFSTLSEKAVTSEDKDMYFQKAYPFFVKAFWAQKNVVDATPVKKQANAKVKLAYYAFYKNHKGIHESVSILDSVLSEDKNNKNAHFDYAWLLLGAEKPVIGKGLMHLCQAICLDPTSIKAQDRLYNLLKNITFRDNASLNDVGLPLLLKAIACQPDALKKTALLELLLDQNHALGFYTLSMKDKDAIYSIIKLMPFPDTKIQYLTLACANKHAKHTLYEIAHIERNIPGIIGSTLTNMENELQMLTKYDSYNKICSLDMYGMQLFPKLLKLARPTTSRFFKGEVEPVLMGDLIRTFCHSFGNQPAYIQLINDLSIDELLKSILAPDVPGAKNMPLINNMTVRNHTLRCCLNAQHMLGKKFLSSGNRKAVELLIMALPDDTLKEKKAKLLFLDHIFGEEPHVKNNLLYKLFQVSANPFETFSIEKEGSLKNLYEEWRRLRLVLGKSKDYEVEEEFELMDNKMNSLSQ